jgi:prepilin-type N-terminal cleavage/methylation domain-containing protein/prepilin-type processing-associated H-X9-DG protein
MCPKWRKRRGPERSWSARSGVADSRALRYRRLRLRFSVAAEFNRQTNVELWSCAILTGMRSRAAFSLIELLITVAIILILTTLYFGPNTANRQNSLKRVCQRNLEKIYVSMEIYANDHAGRFPLVASAKTSAEALDVLIPKYTSDTTPFICPGSKDSALPTGESFRSRKISYAYYMGRFSTNAQQVLMSDRQVDTQSKAAGQSVFSTTGKAPGANHRKFGGNLLFCDGHCEMIPAQAPFSIGLTNGEVLLNP